MAAPIHARQTREFRYGSRFVALMLLVSVPTILLYLIYSLPRVGGGSGLERSLGALLGLVLAGYFAWRQGRGFFLARLTPTEVELRFLFRSERVSRKHVAQLELKVETANIMDELAFLRDSPITRADGWASRRRHEERRQDRMESATKFRVVLTAHSGQEYVSARFDDDKQFFDLRKMLFSQPETAEPPA